MIWLLLVLAANPDVAVQEELRQSDILEGVLSAKTRLISCTEAQKKREPGSSGKLVLTFTVNPSTGAAKVSNPDAEPALFSRCVASAIEAVQFPKHTVQHEPINFPFKY